MTHTHIQLRFVAINKFKKKNIHIYIFDIFISKII